MRGDRHCVRCGDYIGNYLTDDYYALLHRKYCDDCQKPAETESTRLRVEKLRLKTRNENKDNRQKVVVLELENAELRRQIAELRRRCTG